jgi:FkbM family methyltransferase
MTIATPQSRLAVAVWRQVRPLWHGLLRATQYRRGVPVVYGGHALRVSFNLRRMRQTLEHDVELESILNGLAPGQCALDIGANVGLLSVLMAQCVAPTGRVYAFEPVVEAYECLQENARLNAVATIIEPLHLAVGCEPQTLEMFINESPPDTMHSAVPPADGKGSRRQVQAVSVDSFCKERGLLPDVVKVDVEGFEPLVLEGARQTIARASAMTLFVELHPWAWPKINYDETRFRTLIGELGLRMNQLNDQPLGNLTERTHIRLSKSCMRSNPAHGPLVSVVLITFNYARFLPEAIESVLRQTFKDWELIIVDDGSTDNTTAVIAPYLQDHRVHYIRQNNGGQSKARNAGIRATRGEFIALLDADDHWKPDKLEKQLDKFSDDSIGVVFSGSRVFDEHGIQKNYHVDESFCVDTLRKLTTILPFCPSSVVVRKRCFDVCGLFDESLQKVEDREMWIRLAKRYRFACAPGYLVNYRVHGSAQNLKTTGMEQAYRTTLARAFADGPLKGRRISRWKAYAFMYYDFSWIYHSAKRHGDAWRYVVRSLLRYPLPDWRGKLFQVRFARWRRLLRYTFTPNTP